MLFTRYNRLVACLWLIMFSFWAGAQEVNKDSLEMQFQKDSIAMTKSDSGNAQMSDTSVSVLVLKLEQLTTTLNKVNSSLKRGFDTTNLANELPHYENLVALVDDNLINDFNQYNLRNLYVTRVLLIQVENKMNSWQKDLVSYSKKIQQINNDIRSITADSGFRKMPSDTTLLYLYMKQFLNVSRKWNLADSLRKNMKSKIGILQNRVAGVYIKVSDLMEEVTYRIGNYERFIWRQEEPPLFKSGSNDYKISLAGSVDKSLTRTLKILGFYFGLQWPGRIIGLVISLAFFLWILLNKLKIKRSGNESLLVPLRFTSQNTWLSAVLVYFTFSPLIYFSPPAIYVEMLWLVMLGVSTILIWREWTPRFRKFWVVIIFLYLFFGLSNVLVQSSFGERWMLFFLNLLAIALGYFMLKEWRKDVQRYPRYTQVVIWLLILANILAIILNSYGRFTLAKFLSNSSVIGLALATALHIIIELILEALYLQLEAHKNWRVTTYLHFSELRDKFRNFLAIVATFFWLMAFAWSLNLYHFILSGVKEFLDISLQIGNIQFTISNILIFLFIIWISMFLSRLLTYFFGTTDQQFASTQKSKLGSWVLLMRLTIIGAGFMLAIGAAGIPTDKIAIVVGALGVGIGFGMQNIVNNLVSGVILAFEKPMQIGDVIELGTRTGTVKEIGLRSSKITTFDGSVIIVPNGDFISQQLINWTHSNTYRRIEAHVGVAYDTDLEKASHVIQEVLESNKNVATHPPVNILVDNFSDSAVIFRVLFWTNNFDNWLMLKSEVLGAIYQKFKEQGVKIPFPQQDIYVKSLPDNFGTFSKSPGKGE